MTQTGDKKRLWVITELYYPEETSTGYYMTRIAEGLAGRFEVNVICGQPNYSKRGMVAPAFEEHRGVRIYRVAGTRLDKNVIVYRLINMLTLGFSTMFKSLAKFQKGDRVLVVTTPPSLPFISAAASLIKGAGYTLLIHDNYPEILIAAGKTDKKSLLVTSLNFCNRWLYKHARKIVVVGRDMAELAARKTAGLDIPITYIPNWAELEAVSPAPRGTNALLGELGLRDKFVLLYAGNMGYPNDMESVIEAAEILQANEKIHFVFLGAGVKRNWLKQAVSTKALRNVSILDPKPRSEQQNFLNACDVALVSLVGSMWGVSMPSRTYNILAAGKPILALAEEGSEIARVVSEDGVGRVVPPANAEMLTAAILDMAKDPAVLSEMGRRARESAISKYSVETAVERYAEELT